MIVPAYIKPVAYHRDHVHRLLLTDEAGIWYLWHGDFTGLTEIDRSLAQWMYERPEIFPMPGPSMWFEISTLPVVDSGLQSILGD